MALHNTTQTAFRETALPYRFWELLGFPPRSGATPKHAKRGIFDDIAVVIIQETAALRYLAAIFPSTS
jgi:hypothetical protein